MTILAALDEMAYSRRLRVPITPEDTSAGISFQATSQPLHMFKAS